MDIFSTNIIHVRRSTVIMPAFKSLDIGGVESKKDLYLFLTFYFFFIFFYLKIISLYLR